MPEGAAYSRRVKRLTGLALSATVLVAALLAMLVPAPVAAETSPEANCRGIADIPRPADPHSTLPRLYAWGQFECDAGASLAVQVCALRYSPTGLILDAKVVWCIHRVVKVAAGKATFVRTPLHACRPGKEYASYIRIIGQAWDRGPSSRCRSL
jgi:hypothetical protein